MAFLNSQLQKLSHIPQSIWFLGIGTLLMDVGSVLIFTFSPLYLSVVFGMTALGIGIIEGVVNGLSWLMRLVSGLISDYFRIRKPIILWGYSFSFLSRILFVLLPPVGWVFTARILDRLGHGLQASARAAFIADVAPPHLKGACYGLRQALGTAGSVIGALLGMVVMHYHPHNYRAVFQIALIPSLLGILCLFFGVKEPTLVRRKGNHKDSLNEFRRDLKRLTLPFWILVGILFLFSLGWYNEVFLVLFAKNLGVPIEYVPFVMLSFNLASTAASYPISSLSDQKDRHIYLKLGIAAAIAANIVLLFSVYLSWPHLLFGGCILWGAQNGIFHSISASMISDLAAQEIRATAFGVFYIFNGIALFLANSLSGWLSKSFSFSYAFILSCVFAFASLLLLRFYRFSLTQLKK